MGKENGDGGVMKSEDPGVTLEEAGISGDDGGDDGVEDPTDEKAGENESDEAGTAGDDGGGEGKEVDGDRGEDAGKGGEEKSPSELEAIRELVKQKDAELERIRAEKQSANEPAPEPMTEEKWAAIEERFGGMSRAQIQPMAELVDRQTKQIESRLAARFAKIEKDLTINAMAEQDGTRDIRSYRKEIDEYLGNFDESAHSNPKLLRMAYVYARGLRAPEAMKKAVNAKERNLKVVGAGKPNTVGSSAGGKSRGTKLTSTERQAAKLGGMSEAEYAEIKYGSRG